MIKAQDLPAAPTMMMPMNGMAIMTRRTMTMMTTVVPSPSGGFDPYEVFIPLSGSGTLKLFNVFKGLKGAIPWVRIPLSANV